MDNPFGSITPPVGPLGSSVEGIQQLISIILRTLIMFAGIYAVIMIVLAGIAFISASGDPKRISDATSKIWHSVLGFVIAAGAFVLAGIIGEIIYNDPTALLRFRYFTFD